MVLGVKLGDSFPTDRYSTSLHDIPEIRAATKALSEANAVYTIVLYEGTTHRSEAALFPYRISSSHNPVSSVLLSKEEGLPEKINERRLVSSQDLARVGFCCASFIFVFCLT